jgi:hypothetical protein
MQRRNTSLVFLIVAAWMCRALIPPGFMPQTGDHFSVALKICPGHSLHSPLEESGKGKLPQPNQSPASELVCVFSAGVASAPPSAMAFAPFHADALHLPFTSFQTADTGRLIARAQSARGPPLLI